ncbi:hypothetical protein AAMO2058_001758800 [Amorphochlora amoebiformis]
MRFVPVVLITLTLSAYGAQPESREDNSLKTPSNRSENVRFRSKRSCRCFPEDDHVIVEEPPHIHLEPPHVIHVLQEHGPHIHPHPTVVHINPMFNQTLDQMMEYYRSGFGPADDARDIANEAMTNIADQQAYSQLENSMHNQELRAKARGLLYSYIENERRKQMWNSEAELQRKKELSRLERQKDNIMDYQERLSNMLPENKPSLKTQLDNLLKRVKEFHETPANKAAVSWLEDQVKNAKF